LIITPCPRKTVTIRCHNPGKQRRILTKFYANTDTLNGKQQTSSQISVKLVNICNNYSKFSKVTQIHKCPIGAGVIDCQVCVHANGKTSAHLTSVFKMSTMCSNASSEMWMPLPDHFIDDHLVEMFPLFDHARLQLVDVTNLAAVHTLLQLSLN